MRFCDSGSGHLKKRRKDMESGGFTLMHAGNKNNQNRNVVTKRVSTGTNYKCSRNLTTHIKLNKQTNKQIKKETKKER